MRPGIYLAVIGLVVPAMASAQQPMLPNQSPPPFHPSMVEVGTVNPREPHVTFDPPFPSTPKVVLKPLGEHIVDVVWRLRTSLPPDLIIFRRARRVGRLVRYLFLPILKQLGLRPFSNKLAGALEGGTDGASAASCKAPP
jgi:hypothetical protein